METQATQAAGTLLRDLPGYLEHKDLPQIWSQFL